MVIAITSDTLDDIFDRIREVDHAVVADGLILDVCENGFVAVGADVMLREGLQNRLVLEGGRGVGGGWVHEDVLLFVGVVQGGDVVVVLVLVVHVRVIDEVI